MALIVESGTGSATAESYASVAAADLYHSGRGSLGWVGGVADKEAALRRATVHIDSYGRLPTRMWPGTRTNGRAQALAWPRENVIDTDGVEIADDEIPIELVWATLEAAVRELKAPGSLSPDYVPGERVVSESVGPLSVTYAGATGSERSADAVRPTVPAIDALLANLLEVRSNTVTLSRG